MSVGAVEQVTNQQSSNEEIVLHNSGNIIEFPETNNHSSYTPNRRYEEDSENAWSCGSWFEYLLVVILSTILLIGSLVLTIFWVIYYRGGFAWNEDPKLQFNLHPVLMVAGFITFSGFCKEPNSIPNSRNSDLLPSLPLFQPS